MTITFSELGVPEPICQALARRGILEPFDIQAATIADALAGRDVCGRAPTGSGKTLAFGIPIVATVEPGEAMTPSLRGRPGHPGQPRALVLAPTRELAEQISTEIESIAGRVRLGVVYGGVGYGRQITALRRGVDLLVACPGRLEDLIAQKMVDLSLVTQVVIDEADRMADMGFLPAVRRLLDQTASPRQTVLFSATLDGDVARLTKDYQRNPVRHEVGDAEDDRISGDHVFWRADATNRTELTVEAVNAVWPAIVFSRTRHGSDRLARQLRQQGIVTAAIHGGRSQSQRNQALADFSAGRVHALVATDVAARGIHVDGVASVIHYDPPEDHKAYIHRSGRTARAGQSGVVLSLIRPAEAKDVRRLQRQVGLDSPLVDPDPAALRALSDSPRPALVRQPVTAMEADDDLDDAPAGRDRAPRNRGGAGLSSASPASASRTDRPPRRSQRPAGDGERRDRTDEPGRGHRSRQGGLNLTSRTRVARSGNRPAPAGGAEADGSVRAERSTPRRDDQAGPRGRTNTSGGRTNEATGRANGAGGRSDEPAAAGSWEAHPRSGTARPASAGAKGRGPSARTGTAGRAPGAGSSAGAGSASKGRSGAGRGGYGRPSSPGPKPDGNRKARRAHLQWDGKS